jgi:small subunit ribosomal protein S18
MENKINTETDEVKNIDAGDDQRNDRVAAAPPQRRYQRRRQGQYVPDYVDWKDVDFLKRFIPEGGKIMPRRISGVTAKDQRRVARAIKRARIMALIPYVSD